MTCINLSVKIWLESTNHCRVHIFQNIRCVNNWKFIKPDLLCHIYVKMLMNDVDNQEDLHSIVIKNLRNVGVKYRSKKNNKKVQVRGWKNREIFLLFYLTFQDDIVFNNKIFNKPLNCLQLHTVKLDKNVSIQIPQLVHELCSYISCSLETEGLFRKAGSTARQKEIKVYHLTNDLINN